MMGTFMNSNAYEDEYQSILLTSKNSQETTPFSSRESFFPFQSIEKKLLDIIVIINCISSSPNAAWQITCFYEYDQWSPECLHVIMNVSAEKMYAHFSNAQLKGHRPCQQKLKPPLRNKKPRKQTLMQPKTLIKDVLRTLRFPLWTVLTFFLEENNHVLSSTNKHALIRIDYFTKRKLWLFSSIFHFHHYITSDFVQGPPKQCTVGEKINVCASF